MEQQLDDHLPIVSIGLPVYNGELFIREALNSLLVQTFSDFELIISDNASTDNTKAICQEYAAKDKRVRYLRQQVNQGAFANFKFVLDQAVGKYFMWAAADDIWHPSFIEKNYTVLEHNHCVIASISKVRMESLANRSPFLVGTHPLTGSFLSKLRNISWPGEANSRFYSLYDTNVIKKSFVNEIFIGADLCTVVNALKYGDFYEVDEILMERSCNGTSNNLLTQQFEYYGIKGIEQLMPLFRITVWFARNLRPWFFLMVLDYIIKMNVFYSIAVLSEVFHFRKSKSLS